MHSPRSKLLHVSGATIRYIRKRMGETEATGTSTEDTQQKLERTPKPTVKGMVPLQRAPASSPADASRERSKNDE
jgi:hypothetical protein